MSGVKTCLTCTRCTPRGHTERSPGRHTASTEHHCGAVGWGGESNLPAPPSLYVCVLNTCTARPTEPSDCNTRCHSITHPATLLPPTISGVCQIPDVLFRRFAGELERVESLSSSFLFLSCAVESVRALHVCTSVRLSGYCTLHTKRRGTRRGGNDKANNGIEMLIGKPR